MPGYELAKAEIEARGGEIQTASSGGLFAWLFGSRGGGDDDAEERSGQEAVAMVSGRGGGRSGGGGVQIADAGPAAVARAKSNLPTGPAYASAPEPAPKPAPAAKPEPAPAPDVAPAPQPEVVAALEQPKVESDAQTDSPVKLHGPIAALYLAPLPPRRPSERDLLLASIANIPLPPARPSDLAVASGPEAIASGGPLPPVRPAGVDSAPQTTASIGPLPPARPAVLGIPAAPAPSAGAKAPPADSGADLGQLPKVITAGVLAPPPRVLALAEMPPAPAYDRDALLQRAAELTAPLPPMPIPSASAQSERETCSSAEPLGRERIPTMARRIVGFVQVRARRAGPGPARDSAVASVPVDRPGSRAGGGEIEEDEAVERRALAAVERRKEASREMGYEIGGGHIARQNEGGWPGEKAERDQHTADKLHRPGESEHARISGHGQMREAEQLARPVFEKKESDDDPQDGQQRPRPCPGQNGVVHAAPP